MMKYFCLNIIAATIALLFLYFNCNEKKQVTAGSTVPVIDTSYDKVEIYCWCYGPFDTTRQGFRAVSLNTCNTLIQVKPADLIIPGYFVYASEDKKTIAGLKRMVDKHKSSAPSPYGIDSRLVILFRKGRFVADTLATDYPGQFYYNGEFREYSFRLMDSVSHHLHNKIICPG